MKRDGLLVAVILAGLLLNGCSNKEAKVADTQEKVKRDVVSVAKQKSDDVKVEVVPVDDKKVKVITKVQPEVAVIETEKLDKGEIPVVVVDPVKVDDPVKVEEVEILPVVDDTVGIVTKVKPTIEVVEELPLEGEEAPAIVIDPIVE
jgi:PBP1b-binding outer membrane lipoprotein LpoB